MATETTGAPADTVSGHDVSMEMGGEWQGGVVAGLLGGAVMGVLMAVLAPGALTDAIPALVGLSGGVAGWIVHMSISAVFGVAFAAALTHTSLRRYADSTAAATGVGLVYGVVLWIVAAGLVMPIWLQAVGFAGAPALPNLALGGLVTHLAFGLVLGATYPTLVRSFRKRGTTMEPDASPAK